MCISSFPSKDYPHRAYQKCYQLLDFSVETSSPTAGHPPRPSPSETAVRRELEATWSSAAKISEVATMVSNKPFCLFTDPSHYLSSPSSSSFYQKGGILSYRNSYLYKLQLYKPIRSTTGIGRNPSLSVIFNSNTDCKGMGGLKFIIRSLSVGKLVGN